MERVDILELNLNKFPDPYFCGPRATIHHKMVYEIERDYLEQHQKNDTTV